MVLASASEHFNFPILFDYYRYDSLVDVEL